MRRLWRAGALGAGLALAAGACSSSAPPAPRATIVLDGRPRPPDDQGVVTAVSDTSVTLDSSRTYAVSPAVEVFSTSTLQPLSLAGRLGVYVQVGLAKRTIVWLSSFGAVIALPGAQPTAYYIGVFASVDPDGRAVFQDGTVLALGAGVAPPQGRIRVRADIDTAHHTVAKLTPT